MTILARYYDELCFFTISKNFCIRTLLTQITVFRCHRRIASEKCGKSWMLGNLNGLLSTRRDHKSSNERTFGLKNYLNSLPRTKLESKDNGYCCMAATINKVEKRIFLRIPLVGLFVLRRE